LSNKKIALFPNIFYIYPQLMLFILANYLHLDYNELMECKQHKTELKILLNNKKLKATPGRLGLLDIFIHQAKPISVAELKSKVGDKTDLVTLYRNAEILTKIGALKRIRLQDKKDYYEFAQKAHHHHLVCTNCGKVSDVKACAIKPINNKILKLSGFVKIESHSLEFFGVCKMCGTK
jgi:Fur family ferric uptake transcriptional regulator